MEEHTVREECTVVVGCTGPEQRIPGVDMGGVVVLPDMHRWGMHLESMGCASARSAAWLRSQGRHYSCLPPSSRRSTQTTMEVVSKCCMHRQIAAHTEFSSGWLSGMSSLVISISGVGPCAK